MKQYKPLPGIVHTKICGVHVLIPSREAYKDCPSIQRLPLLWALSWDTICNTGRMEDVVEVHRILTKESDDVILERLEKFCRAMAEKNFMIEIPEEN